MSLRLERWLDLLACPTCGAEITVRAGGDEQLLACTSCQLAYPVIDGIVRCRTAPDESDRDAVLKQQEIAARDRAADGYESGIAALRNAMEIPPSLASMDPRSGDTVAELGCGTGRFTLRYAPLVDRGVAIDFSSRSLACLQRRLSPQQRERILLVEADISVPLPLKRRAFSKVVSFQVLEHIPSHESRRSAFAQAAQLLEPGGTFTCSVYNWSKHKRRDAGRGVGDNNLKEGFHLTGIYYYNFQPPELRELVRGAGLDVEDVQGLIIPIRGARLLGGVAVLLNRMLARTGFGLDRGMLLLARGRAAEQQPADTRALPGDMSPSLSPASAFSKVAQ